MRAHEQLLPFLGPVRARGVHLVALAGRLDVVSALAAVGVGVIIHDVSLGCVFRHLVAVVAGAGGEGRAPTAVVTRHRAKARSPSARQARRRRARDVPQHPDGSIAMEQFLFTRARFEPATREGVRAGSRAAPENAANVTTKLELGGRGWSSASLFTVRRLPVDIVTPRARAGGHAARWRVMTRCRISPRSRRRRA